MQVATGVGPVVAVLQVVVVQALPEAAVAGAQVATPTLVVLLLPQDVVTQLLPADPATAVQEATPVGPVVTGAGQVVAV